MTKKITEKRLKWYGHVKKRNEGFILIRMSDAPLPGKRWRATATKFGLSRGLLGLQYDQINASESEGRKPGGKTMENVGLKEEDALDRTKWKNDIQYHSGDSR